MYICYICVYMANRCICIMWIPSVVDGCKDVIHTNVHAVGKQSAATPRWERMPHVEDTIDLLPCRQCCSPRGKSWSRGPVYKSLSLDHKVLEKDFTFCKLSVMYDNVTSINSVAATMHGEE